MKLETLLGITVQYKGKTWTLKAFAPGSDKPLFRRVGGSPMLYELEGYDAAWARRTAVPRLRIRMVSQVSHYPEKEPR